MVKFLDMFRRRGSLEERVALLEAKYEQLAREVGRIEKDLIRIYRLLEELKYIKKR